MNITIVLKRFLADYRVLKYICNNLTIKYVLYKT